MGQRYPAYPRLKRTAKKTSLFGRSHLENESAVMVDIGEARWVNLEDRSANSLMDGCKEWGPQGRTAIYSFNCLSD